MESEVGEGGKSMDHKILDWWGLPYVLVALVGIIIAEAVWVLR